MADTNKLLSHVDELELQISGLLEQRDASSVGSSPARPVPDQLKQLIASLRGGLQQQQDGTPRGSQQPADAGVQGTSAEPTTPRRRPRFAAPSDTVTPLFVVKVANHPLAGPSSLGVIQQSVGATDGGKSAAADAFLLTHEAGDAPAPAATAEAVTGIKRKRGRPKKSTTTYTPSPTKLVPKDQEDAEESPENPQKRRRGRPPKRLLECEYLSPGHAKPSSSRQVKVERTEEEEPASSRHAPAAAPSPRRGAPPCASKKAHSSASNQDEEQPAEDTSDQVCDKRNETPDSFGAAQEGSVIAQYSLPPAPVNLSVFRCFLCQEDFETSKEYLRHCKRKNEIPFHCPICDKAHGRYYIYRQHMWIHTGQMPFECRSCKKPFRIKESMLQHERAHKKKSSKGIHDFSQTKAVNDGPYRCFNCEVCFATMDDYRGHCVLQKEKPCYCQLCDVTHTKYSKYEEHMRGHADQEVFVCSYCDAMFPSEDSLMEHEETHLEETDGAQLSTIEIVKEQEERDMLVDAGVLGKRQAEAARKDDGEGQQVEERAVKVGGEAEQVGEGETTEVEIDPEEGQADDGLMADSGHQSTRHPETVTNKKSRMVTRQQNKSAVRENPTKSKKVKMMALKVQLGRRVSPPVLRPPLRDKSTGKATPQQGTTKVKEMLEEPDVKIAIGIMVCFVCGSGFPTMRKLHAHAVEHSRSRLCPICGEDLTGEVDRDAHVSQHTGGRQYQCKTCGETTTSFQALNDHSREHAHLTPYACCSCDKTFSLPRDLVMHFSTHHYEADDDEAQAQESSAEKSTYRCFSCTEDFSTLAEYKGHCQLEDETPFHCTVCSVTFARYVQYREHMKDHAGEEPCPCPICSQVFKTKKIFRQHMEGHLSGSIDALPASEGRRESRSGSQPNAQLYRCYTCLEDMASLKEYKEHCKRKKEIPLHCLICDKTFSIHFRYTEHMRNHTGEKPFPCSYCSRAFKTKDSMFQHEKRHRSGKIDRLSETDGRRVSRIVGQTKSDPYRCYICMEDLPNLEEYKKHCKLKSEVLFGCPSCKKTFPNHFKYTEHMRKHTGDKPFQCPHCLKSYRIKDTMVRHTKIHLNKNKKERHSTSTGRDRRFFRGAGMSEPYKCFTCDAEFSSPEEYKAHCGEKHDGKLFFCMRCGRSLAQYYVYRCHMMNHLGNKPCPCPTCGKRFVDELMMQKHQKVHSGEGRHVCYVCGVTRSHKLCFMRHMATHTNEWPFKCSECNKGFVEERQYNVHLAEHADGWPYKCAHCQKPCQESHLARHEARCVTAKNIVCHTCGECFKTRFKYSTHMIIKHNQGGETSVLKFENGKERLVVKKERTVSCPSCPRTFVTKQQLSRHSFTHSTTKPYKCHKCSKPFSYKDCLKKHMHTHRREKPFKCDRCWKSFTTREVYRKHVRREHDCIPVVPRHQRRKKSLAAEKVKGMTMNDGCSQDSEEVARVFEFTRDGHVQEVVIPTDDGVHTVIVKVESPAACDSPSTELQINEEEEESTETVTQIFTQEGVRIIEDEETDSKETVTQIITPEGVRIIETGEEHDNDENVTYIETSALLEHLNQRGDGDGADTVILYVGDMDLLEFEEES